MAKKKSRSPFFSLTLLAAGCVVLLIAFQVTQLFFTEGIFVNKKTGLGKLTGNAFKDMAYTHPKSTLELTPKIPPPQLFKIKIFSHNPIEGDINAPLKLVVVTDPACGTCRAQVKKILKIARPLNIPIIFQFSPMKEENANGGLFEQIAWQHGVWPEFHQATLGLKGDIDFETFSIELEKLGITLKQQRHILAKESREALKNLEKDIQQLKVTKIPELPAVFLDGYRIDGLSLKISELRKYVVRLRAVQPIKTASSS